MIAILHQRGLHLPGHDLWLDPHRAQALAFVSHAHSDHIARHREVVLSPATARLMNARLSGKRIEHRLAFGQTQDFAGGRVTLLPAGHILGSAQFHFETDAGSLLYTGDFKLTHGLTAEPCEWRRADTLIMETTFGLPRYRMPPRAEVAAQVVAFCTATLDAGETPVLLGYSLGKAQEIIHILLTAGLAPMLHESVWKMTALHRELDPSFPKGGVRFKASESKGRVIVCPPSAARDGALEKVGPRRTAVLTGWAIDPGAKYRYGCDAAFPLSDHADYDELLRYVELVQPKRVLTVHGFAAEFATDLRRRGVEAWALAGENQLELMLG
ncbi:MAG: MBL fold metallo-hydrolase [Chthoniobacteraceae bacterium]